MPQTVHVDLGERGYDIQIGSNLPIGSGLAGASGVKALIVSDASVEPLYGERCERALTSAGLAVTRAVVPAGESSKEQRWVTFLYDRALAAGLDRSSVIVALGGGVIGDLAGFAAGTFLRGVRLIQVPTSLLAMVDSSVGGKTGINLAQGKNLVGVFHQPIEVVADLTTLETLPGREYLSGLAEMVKYGVIWDRTFFKQLEGHTANLLDRDLAFLEKAIRRCCEIKAEVVAMDEHEVGPRAILNFGHTVAHALETVAGYGEWLHGEAVAVGMAFAARLSVRQKGFPEPDCGRLIALLEKLGLPARWHPLQRPGGGTQALDWPALREAMAADKKTRAGVPRFVLAEKLGSVVIGCEVPETALREAWNVGDQ